ncbi:ion transporter [Marinobacter sp.]|uniref:ion transporter n=1 Tax=Marinobacter sp. TaxID=50741 RepID=UPI003F951C23
MSPEVSPFPGFNQLCRIESSTLFQGVVISIIVLSALTIGAKTYDLPPLVEQSLSLMDAAITLFFLVEILFRFAASPVKRRFLLDGWNLFDTLVVIGSLIPLDNSEAVLLGRLLRVFRVLRLVSVVPELRFLINSLLKAIPRMGYIALLMFIIFYIYAAMGSMFFASVDNELWGDVAISMLTLFRVATFEDWTDVMYATMEQYPLSWIYYLTFIFLTAFVFLNMMIGAILEVMSEEQNARQAQQAHDERDEINRQLREVQSQLAELLSHAKTKQHGPPQQGE